MKAILDLKYLKDFASDEEIKYGIERALNWTFLQEIFHELLETKTIEF
jgi:hypothetical protein